MKIKQWVFYAAVAVLLIGGQFFATRNSITGTPPYIAAKTLDGESVEKKLRAAGPALIYFWAAWCGICRAMQDSITAILGEYPGITVALQSGSDAEVRAYLHKHHLAWPAVADPQGEIAARYGIKGVPAVFIVDKRGLIRFSSIGFSSETGLRTRLWLAKWWE